MKGNQLLFNYICLLYYKLHKINPSCSGSYIDSPDWKKKATMISINKNDNKLFQYAVTVMSNHEEIKKRFPKNDKIKPFMNEYNQRGINVAPEKGDWKKIENNIRTIALNVMCAKNKKYIPLMFQNITQIVKNKLFF